jgi:TPP-dependent pyruvate/acetoin dehydrogenase alpha subunit
MAMAWDSSMISGEHSDWHLSYDGLLLLVRDLLDAGHLTQRVVQEIDNAVQMEVDEAIRFGLDSQYPDAETALDTVFA